MLNAGRGNILKADLFILSSSFNHLKPLRFIWSPFGRGPEPRAVTSVTGTEHFSNNTSVLLMDGFS